MRGCGYALLPLQYTGGGDELIELSHAGRVTLAVMVWMALWWLTEATEISATAVKTNGVAEFIGHATTSFAGGGGVSPVIVVLVVTTMVIFLTELTSNTATTAALVPILAAVAPGLGLHPYLLIFPATIAASCAFMLPVATPPNAIVFGSGHLTIAQMCKAGLPLNIVSIGLITLLTFAVIKPFVLDP